MRSIIANALIGLVTTLSSASLTSVAAAQDAEAPRYALLIGIGEYGKGAPRLPAAQNDLTAMRELLVHSYGFTADRILTIRDAVATRDKVMDAIRTHLGQAGADQLAFLYFVGHGVQMAGNLSVQDFEPTGVDQAIRLAGHKDNILLDDELWLLMQELNSDRVLAVVDACYAGSIGFKKPSVAAKQGQLPPKPKGGFISLGADVDFSAPAAFISDDVTLAAENGVPGLADISPYMIMAGTTDDDRAFSGVEWPDAKTPRSVFSYHLINQLGAAPPGWTMRDLSQSTRKAVLTDPLCKKHEMCQRPLSRGSVLDAPLVDVLRH